MSVIKNAVITSATISYSDHNVLTVWLQLDYGGLSQGFGGYALYLPKSFKNHAMYGGAGHFIYRCMEIAGVEDWSKLVGKAIRVKSDCEGLRGSIQAIGHIVKDDWFNPEEDFKRRR